MQVHEFSAVQSLVKQLRSRLTSERAERVIAVRLRRASAFSEAVLKQSFEVLTKDSILEGARLEVETVETLCSCPCGHSQMVTSDDLQGHMFVCPTCGRVHELAHGDDLEVLALVLEDNQETSPTS
jgi:hydrogenase nickel incorporation protein HypA/HybF